MYGPDGALRPAVGDWVALRGERAVALLPRTSAFTRTAAGRTSAGQVLAANIDIACGDRVAGTRCRGASSGFWPLSGAPARHRSSSLTKADLRRRRGRGGGGGRRGGARRRGAAGQLADGRPASRQCGPGCGPGRTAAMVGPSGVGKSSLSTRSPAARSRRRGRSASDGRGRHTTTARELHLLPGGGLLATPRAARARRSYDDPAGSTPPTPTSSRWSPACRFRDCAHRTEPGCAVADAVDDGRLDPARFLAWRKLEAEAHRQLLRADARARAAGARTAAGPAPGAAGAARPAALTGPVVHLSSFWRPCACWSSAPEPASTPCASRWPSDPAVTALVCAPGNAGTARSPSSSRSRVADPDAVAALRRGWRADLVVVGPEAPLVAGVADAVRAAGHRLLRPVRGGRPARGQQGVRQGRHGRRRRADRAARGRAPRRPRRARGARRVRRAYVVKDDGLAAGKGVVVTDDRAAALAHAAACDAGTRCVVEEYLDGPEVSLFARHRRRRRSCRSCPRRTSSGSATATPGPNTGGMGAYAPLPWAPAGLVDQIMAHGRCSRRSTRWRAAARRSPGCSTPDWR